MQKPVDIQESELKTLYVEQGLTQREIAQKHGVARRTIGKLMQRLGIPIREQKQTQVEHPCLNCGETTTNPKFCSSSCAAIYNNQHFPKRKKQKREWICVQCGNPTTERRKYCDGCSPDYFKWMERTIGELSRDGSYQMYRTVRALARRIYNDSGRPLACAICGYSDHIEICHIKAISSFDKKTRIREVNRLENLVALCPNHHWEFDRGRIDLEL
ncbi:MAG: HNH endonuclease [Chloroflexi bacterium]|nr:HNH endonuclease [Chloroflexota bacterium]